MELDPGADAAIIASTITTNNNNNAESMTDPLTKRVLRIAYTTGVLMETPSGYFKAMSWISDGRWRTHFISGEWFSLEYPSLRMTIADKCVRKVEFRAYLHNHQQERWLIDTSDGVIERHPGGECRDPERIELGEHPGVFYIPATDWTDGNCGARCRHALETLRHNLIAFLKARGGRTHTRDFLLLHQLAHHINTMTSTGPPQKYAPPKSRWGSDSVEKTDR